MRLSAFLLLFSLSFSTLSHSQDLTRREISDVLYSSKLTFTKSNIPVVTILIMEGKEKISFSSPKNLKFLPEGEYGAEIIQSQSSNFSAKILDGKPAEFKYFLCPGKFRQIEIQKMKEEKWIWEGRKFRMKIQTIGSIFGFYGHVLDNRVNLLIIDEPKDSEKDAQAMKEKLKNTYGVDAEIRREMIKKPEGVIEITDEKGTGFSIRSPEVIWISQEPENEIKIKNVEYAKGYSWAGSEDRKYRGQIYFTVDTKGHLAVVNVIDAEALLKGIVPSEIYTNAPQEALKAQAVTARGELFAKLGLMHINDPFQSCAEQHCQVYSGTSKENPLVSKAVDATTGEMLFFREELVDSVYSACCGGHTESSSFVWGTAEKPYLAGVPDVEKGTGEISEKNIENWIRNPPKEAFCASTSFGNKSFRWSKTVLFKDIEKNINSIQKIGSLKDLVILERGKSGRISKILAKGSAGEVMLQPELKIRKVLGDLKSSMFIFSLEKNDKGEIQSVNFSGGGFGHGAGMCQMGAIGMAEKGHNYKEILKHYYSGAEVIKIY